jgi:hypothetical protein
MSPFDKIKHPGKKLLDEAEARCTRVLSRLLESGLEIASTSNDLESLYLYEFKAPEDSRLGLEVHYEVSRQHSGTVAELVFRDEDGNPDKASLFRLCWWSDKGWFIELETVADDLAPSKQAHDFAEKFSLLKKGQSRLVFNEEIDTVLASIVERFKSES